MKTREEFVEELATEMCEEFGTEACEEYCGSDVCANRFIAEKLYDAGYRKQSDTVREFVERLKQSLVDLYPEKNEKISLPDLEIDGIDIEMTINNLAAEYGVEVEQ